jgi:hypothetical protein
MLTGHVAVLLLTLMTFVPSSSLSLCKVTMAVAMNGERQGCCSYHGGVCGCSGGRALCCDGRLSPSCGC